MRRVGRLPIWILLPAFAVLILTATLSLENWLAFHHSHKAEEQSEAALGSNDALTRRSNRVETNANTLGTVAMTGSLLACLLLLLAMRHLLRLQRREQESRNLLSATLSSIGDAVITTDAEGVVTFLNPVAEALTGWPSSEACAQPLSKIFQIVNQQTRAPVESPVARVLQLGTVVGLANHTTLIARDGTECPIDDAGSPIRDKTGAVKGVVLVFRDVSERYRAQQELEASEQRHRMLFENNPVPMWIFDEETLEFLDVNAAAIAHYGYTREEFLSMTLRDIRPPEDVLDLLADIGQHRTTRHTDGPWRHRRKDGSVIAVEITAVPIEAFGRSAKFVSATDVTTRVMAEAELRRSEEQYRVIVETATDAVITIDQDSRILFASAPVESIFGYQPDELLGRSITELMPEALRAAHLAGFRRYLETNQRGTSWKLLEFPGRRKDGSEVPLELSFGEFHSGSRRWFTGVIRDVSERRRTQEMLQQSRELIQTVVETVPLAVWGIDLLGRVQFWNRAAANIFQWDEVDLRGRELPIIPEEQRAEFQQQLSEFATGQQLKGLERSRVRKDGKRITCAIWTAPLRSPGGSIVGTVGVLADISERKLADEQARKHLQHLAAYQRELEQFAWVASHSLQEPARELSAQTEAFERQYSQLLPENARAALKTAGSASSRVAAMAESLREYWDLQHHRLNRKPVSLESVLDAAIERLAAQLSASEAKVTCSHLPAVSGDRELLTDLFVHLLENALKFHSRVRPEIHVSAEELGESWVIRVQDNGIGMESRNSDRAFRLFEKLGREQPGIGCGLSFAQQIMRRHDGEISITSQPNGGTTVYLTFKRQAETATQIGVAAR